MSVSQSTVARAAAATVERMALVMRAHEAAHGACTWRNLLNAGFAPDEIKKHGDAAIARAARLREACEPGCVLGLPDPAAVRRRIDRAAARAASTARALRWSPGFAS